MQDVHVAIIEQFNRYAGELGAIEHPLTVLDVACHTGVLGDALTRSGATVFGLDLSEEAIEEAKHRLLFAAHADASDIEELPLEICSRLFDVIVFVNILEHVYDPGQLLLGYRPLLGPNGIMLLCVPNVAFWEVRLLLMLGRWEYDKTNISIFTRSSMEELVRDIGFDIVRSGVTPRSLHAVLGRLMSRLRMTEEGQGAIETDLDRMYFEQIYPAEFKLANLFPSLLGSHLVLSIKPRNS